MPKSIAAEYRTTFPRAYYAKYIKEIAGFADEKALPTKAVSLRMKYWETIANRLMKAGWSLGWVSAIDSEGRTIWIVDAHRDDGRHFIVRANEKLDGVSGT